MTIPASEPAEPHWRRLGPDARRSHILSAAVRLFGEQPYDAVQMAAVARAAGVTRGILNHYFGTKWDLYLEVVRTMMIVPEDVPLPRGTLRERVDDQAAQRVLDAVGYIPPGQPGASSDVDHATGLATLRGYGGLVRAAAREWMQRQTLTRDQARPVLINAPLPLVVPLVDEDRETNRGTDGGAG